MVREVGDKEETAWTGGKLQVNESYPMETVVIAIQGDDLILYNEYVNNFNTDWAFFRLKRDAVNTSNYDKFPRLRQIVLVEQKVDLEGPFTVDDDGEVIPIPLAIMPRKLATKYRFTEEMDIDSWNRGPWNEIGCIYSDEDDFAAIVKPIKKCPKSSRNKKEPVKPLHPNSIRIVSPSFYNTSDEIGEGKLVFQGRKYLEKEDEKWEFGRFVMLNNVEFEGISQIVEIHPSTKEEFFFYAMESGSYKNAVVYPIEMRYLTEEETHWIKTRLRTMENVTLADAQLFIRDPHVTAYLMEHTKSSLQAEEAKLSTKNVDIKITETGKLVLCLYLTEEENERLCKRHTCIHAWRNDMELQVSHKYLTITKKIDRKNVQKSGYMIIKSIQERDDGTAKVILLSTTRSADLLRVIATTPDYFEQESFHFSPADFMSKCVEAITIGFNNFYENKVMFDRYTGRAEPVAINEIPDRETPFYVKGEPLDSSQLDFMRAASFVPGWTCAQAPPGCGKTHTTSALVANLQEMKNKTGDPKGGLCISGTTNAAVTNAADSVKANFSHIKILRNFSGKAEENISVASKEISVRHLAHSADTNYPEALENPKFNNKFYQHQRELIRLETGFQNATKHKSYWENNQEATRKINDNQLNIIDQSEKTGKQVMKLFFGAIDLHVYATTSEILIRSEDVFGLNDEEEEDSGEFSEQSGLVKKKSDPENSITRIILDEAAQLSPVEALAIYCKLPNLTHVTLLGDIYQLGPQSRLHDKSEVYAFLTEGELTRMYHLPSSHRKNLKVIYRCHPRITQLLLVPIYGKDNIQPGVTAEQRTLAKTLKLPRCTDGSPVAFIHVAGQEKNNVNEEEADAFFEFCAKMHKTYKVKAEDIVTLCHHRAQLAFLKRKLEQIGKARHDDYYTNISKNCYTVDSFQGKESPIIAILTTKSTFYDSNIEEKMQFIGEKKRATVAVSRAQQAIYIFGNWPNLAAVDFWKPIIPTIRRHGGLLEIRWGDFKPANSDVHNRVSVNCRKSNENNDRHDTKPIAEDEEKIRLLKERMELMKDAKALRGKKPDCNPMWDVIQAANILEAELVTKEASTKENDEEKEKISASDFKSEGKKLKEKEKQIEKVHEKEETMKENIETSVAPVVDSTELSLHEKLRRLYLEEDVASVSPVEEFEDDFDILVANPFEKPAGFPEEKKKEKVAGTFKDKKSANIYQRDEKERVVNQWAGGNSYSNRGRNQPARKNEPPRRGYNPGRERIMQKNSRPGQCQASSSSFTTSGPSHQVSFQQSHSIYTLPHGKEAVDANKEEYDE